VRWVCAPLTWSRLPLAAVRGLGSWTAVRSPTPFSAAPSKWRQNLARKARNTTPYQILAEAIEELNIRSILRARYRLAPERALANAVLFLEIARAYDGRGLTAFTLAMRRNWNDTEAQFEGRPDAETDSVPIMTMHLAKGLEWPIVIPINSPTELYDDTTFLHRRSDDTVHSRSSTRPRPTMKLSRSPNETSCAASASASGTSHNSRLRSSPFATAERAKAQ
jgi:hypothetical protein